MLVHRKENAFMSKHIVRIYPLSGMWYDVVFVFDNKITPLPDKCCNIFAVVMSDANGK